MSSMGLVIEVLQGHGDGCRDVLKEINVLCLKHIRVPHRRSVQRVDRPAPESGLVGRRRPGARCVARAAVPWGREGSLKKSLKITRLAFADARARGPRPSGRSSA